MRETHEDRSCFLVKHINEDLQLLSPSEVVQVQDMIMGRHDLHPNRAFLYSIVCNKINGVDVDKIAYLQQDAYRCRLPGFQHEYLILGMSVGPDQQLQFASKTKDDVERLFETRRYMFRTVYRHRTVRRFEKLLLECLSNIVKSLQSEWCMERWIELDDVAVISTCRKEMPDIYHRFVTRDLPAISKEEHAQWLEEHVQFMDQRYQLSHVKFV
jgi:HD superfamily phosphohydrolase